MFEFLADRIPQMSTSNLAVVIKDGVARNHTISLNGIASCSHKKAETCIFVQAGHEVEKRMVLMVKNSDPDVLTKTISVMPLLQAEVLLWMAFGKELHLR